MPTIDNSAADELRAARRDLSAREGADLTLSEVLRRAVAALRQLTGLESKAHVR